MIEKKGHVGESFAEYLKEQGTLAETTAVAVKRVLAWQLQQVMAEQRISKNAFNAGQPSESHQQSSYQEEVRSGVCIPWLSQKPATQEDFTNTVANHNLSS